MKQYQFFAVISMVFAGLTAVIAKAGLKNVSYDTGLAVRTFFVFVLVWINVYLQSTQRFFQSYDERYSIARGFSINHYNILDILLQSYKNWKCIRSGTHRQRQYFDYARVVFCISARRINVENCIRLFIYL